MLDGSQPMPTADTSSAPLRVTLVLDTATSAMLDVSQLALPGTQLRVHAGNLASFAADAPLRRATDVLICQVDAADPVALEAFERFTRDHAATLPVVGAARDMSIAVTRRMMRAQTVDILAIPFTPEELAQAIQNGRERQQAIKPAGRVRGGRVVTMIGALGGTGVTALATQAGILWADRARVCLIDLDVQFGNAALYLGLKPQLSVADLLDAGERLDAEFLRSVADRHASGLEVIACPPDIMPLDSLTPEFVDRLIDLATESYDIVLVDLPTAWMSWSLSALQKSDTVCMVTALSVPGVHQARRQLELLEANGLSDRLRLIVNRVVHPLFGKADLGETEKVLRRKVNFTIANDYPTVSAAIDEGRPIGAIKVKARIEKDVRALVEALAVVNVEVTA